MFIIYHPRCNEAFKAESLDIAYKQCMDDFDWCWEDLEVYESTGPIETEIKVVRKQTVVKKER